MPSSTYSELYADYTDAIKSYNTKLDVTPQSFMRALTKATRLFNRETELVTYSMTVTPDTNNLFTLPTNVLRILEVKDHNFYSLISQSPEQFSFNVEVTNETGIIEVPSGVSHLVSNGITNRGDARIFTLQNRSIYFTYRTLLDDKLYIRFVPDLEAYSRNSSLWATWFINEDSFDTEFNRDSILPDLSPYEGALVDYAVGEYLKSNGSANYKVYEQSFWQEVERAKINKPTLFTNGTPIANFPFIDTHFKKYGF